MNHSPSDTGHPDSTPDTDTAASEYPTTIEDPSTGARITFLERGIDERGTYLLVEGVLPPRTDGGPARLHPRSEARSEVVDGRAVVTVSGEEMLLLPGESVIIGAGDPHTIHNGDEGPLVVRTTLRPPGGYEAAIRALYDLGAGGRPDPLGVAAVLYRHREDIRLAGVPWRLQRPILWGLAGVARALGRAPA
jgi:mannose-6-phosphate isomerase-like protein (cupin superfamily)